jgi:hypothetical protein
VDEVVDADDDDPQAARVTAATPRADRAMARRKEMDRRIGRGLDSAEGALTGDDVVLISCPCRGRCFWSVWSLWSLCSLRSLRSLRPSLAGSLA